MREPSIPVSTTATWTPRPVSPARESVGTPSLRATSARSEEHTSELQSRFDLVCRLLLEKKNTELSLECHDEFHRVKQIHTKLCDETGLVSHSFDFDPYVMDYHLLPALVNVPHWYIPSFL